MIAITVPIVETNGRLVSTLSFPAPEQRLPLAEATQHTTKLRLASGQLSSLLTEDDEVTTPEN